MKKHIFWGLTRIALGWVFLWAFLDKVWGLGFTTTSDAAWISGGSPTAGFLKFATKGPFVDFFQNLAGQPWVDWVFMLGLLLIGVGLILGIAVRLACYSGALMLILMYIAGFIPPEHNPVVDEHIVYALVLLGLSAANTGDHLGFGRAWSRSALVRKYPILK